jgi:DNA-binding LytR/AlgR family response regulator
VTAKEIIEQLEGAEVIELGAPGDLVLVLNMNSVSRESGIRIAELLEKWGHRPVVVFVHSDVRSAVAVFKATKE